jgi:hypothetical protein
VAELAGWYDKEKQSLEHVPFGLVLGENGGKLSSRDGIIACCSNIFSSMNKTLVNYKIIIGTPLRLSSLLDESVAATKQAIIAAKSILRSDRKKQFVSKSESASQYSVQGALSFQISDFYIITETYV